MHVRHCCDAVLFAPHHFGLSLAQSKRKPGDDRFRSPRPGHRQKFLRSLFIDELEQLLAGRRLELLEIDRAVIVRIGGSYAFPMDEFTLAPIGWLDIGDGDVALLLGLGFGIRF